MKIQEQLILDLINKKYKNSEKDSRIYLSEKLLLSYNINFEASYDILLDLARRGFIYNLKQEEVFVSSENYLGRRLENPFELNNSFNISKNFKELYKKISKGDEIKKKKKNIHFINDHLNINGIKINFNTKPIQKDLLNTIFKDPKKNWSNDEIYEDWGEKEFQPKTKKFYTAGNGVNKYIKEKAGIDDFLELSTKYIKINEKYIKLVR